MEPWRIAWRTGFAPQLSESALRALLAGLTSNDPCLCQGVTTVPTPLACVEDWACEGACAIGYAGWKGENLTTVGEVEHKFARACYEADQALGEPAGCRFVLNWFDGGRREEVFPLLAEEVRLELSRRAGREPGGVNREDDLMPDVVVG